MMFRNKKEMGKRGQVTVFIIIGVLIVLISGVLLFVNRDKLSVTRGVTSGQVEPVRDYIRDCVESKIKELLPNLRRYGGYSGLNAPYHYYSDEDVSVNFLNGKDVNGNFFSKENVNVDSSIANYIFSDGYCNVGDEFNIGLYRMPTIEDVRVNVNSNEIQTNIELPYEIVKGDVRVQIGVVTIRFEDNFGRYFEIASQIISAENDGSGFDAIKRDLIIANPDFDLDPNHDGDIRIFGIGTLEEAQLFANGNENFVPFRFAMETKNE